ncbi:copper-transporting ATPase [Plasmodium gaboni]|uniref:Copper-transporting ATPase n=1 Tax=Plasmodium gaboni TaxID=647221 RepID=A0A151LLG0_9APIC|nr:copper-transporting ATPase [Plasmodium gaboni]KYO00034.1 copper-transporting ATPase [Plasmodium gaboni]
MAKLSLTINNVDDNFKRKIKKAKFEGVEDLKLKNRKLTISYNPKVMDSYGVIERIKHLDINGDILKDDTDISSKKGNSFIFSMYKEEIEEENVVKKTNIFDNNENMQNIHNNMDNNDNNNNLYGVNDRDNYDKMNYNDNNEDNNFNQIYDINNRVNNYSYPNGEDLYEQLDNAYDNKNYEENYQNYEVSSQNYKENYQSYQVSSQTYKDNYQNYKDNYQNYKENYQNYKDNYQNHDENYKPHGEDYQNCNVSEKNENINSNYNSTNNKGDLYDINYYPNQVEKVEESEGVEENRKSSKFSVLNLFNNIKKAKDKKKMKKEVKKDYLNEDYNNLDKSILLSNDMYKDVQNKTYNNSNDIYNSNNNYYYDYNEDKLKKKNFNFRDYESYRDKQNIYICELKIYNMTCDNCGKKIINFLKDKKLILEGNSYATENKIKLKIDISSDIIPCNNNVKMFVNTIMNEIKESGFNNDLLDLYKDDKNRCNLSEITLYIYRDDIIKSYTLLKDIKGISNVEYDLKKEYIYFLYDPELVGIRYILEILKKKKNVDAYYDEDKEKYFRSSQNNETNNTWKLIELSICIFISIIIIVLNNYQMNMGSMNSFYSYTKNIFNNSNKINKDNIKHPSIYNNIGKGTIVDQPTLDIYFEKVKNQEMLNEYINKNRRRDGKGTFFINSNFKFNKKNKDSDVNRKLVNDNIKKGQILSDKEDQSMEYNNTVNMVSEQVNTSHYNNQEDHKDYPLDNGNNVSKYIEHTNSENMRKNYLLNEKDDDDDNNKEQNLNNNNCKKDNFNNGYNKDDYYDEEHYDLIPIDDFKQNDISEKHPDNKKGDNTKNAYSRFRKHDNTNIKNKNNMNDSDGNKEDNNIDGIYILKQKDNKRQVIKGDEENKDNFTLKGEERNDEKVETEMSDNFLNNEEKSDNKNSNEKNDKYYNYLKKKEKKHDSSNDEYNTNDKFLEKKERKEENNENSENMESVGILKKKENNVDSENKESASLLKKNDEKVIENTNDANNIGDIVLKKREKNEENNENSENMENVSLLKKKENEDNENTNDVNNVGDIILKKKQRKDDIKENGENMESASLLKKKEKKDDNKENGENMEGASLLKKKEKKDNENMNDENNVGDMVLKKKEKKDDNKENGENVEGASLLKKKEKKDNENTNDANNVGDIVLKKKERKEENNEDEENKDNKNTNEGNNENDHFLNKKEKKNDNNEDSENMESASLLKKKEKKDNENMNDENNESDHFLKKKEEVYNNSPNEKNEENENFLRKKENADNKNTNSQDKQNVILVKNKKKKDDKNSKEENDESDNFLKKKVKTEDKNTNDQLKQDDIFLKNKQNEHVKSSHGQDNQNDDTFLKKKKIKDENDNSKEGENVSVLMLCKKEDGNKATNKKCDTNNSNDTIDEGKLLVSKEGDDKDNHDVKHSKNEQNENNSYDETEEDNCLMKKKKKKDENNTKDEKENIDVRKNKNIEINNEENNDTYKNEKNFMNKNNTYNNSHKNEENEESHFSFNTLFYKLANYSIYLDMDKKIVQSSSLRLFFIFVLSSFIYIYYGFSFVMNGYKNLKNNMINMNVLISISSSFSYFYSLLLLLFCLIFSIDINGIPLYFDSSALLICIMKFGCEIENFLVSFSKKKMEDLYESTAKNVYILEKKNRYNQEEEGKFNSNIKIKSMSNISKVYGKDNNSNSIIANNQINSNDILQSVGKENIKVDTLKSNLSFSTSSFFLSNQFLYEDEEINKILSDDMDININDYNINSYPVQFIQKNDILIFYEGATLLIDGIKINKGISCVDENMISGEKNAIKKYKGDKVYAGSKCVEGVVIIYVKDISKGNYIEYVKKTLDEINCKKTNLQLYADKIASIFIPFILILCIVVFFIWFILTFFDIVNIRKENYFKLNRFLSCVFFSVHFSLSILCVACPCAVGLASPLSIAISSYICSSIGIIIKNINIFEIFLECKHFIFDKTGTLTVGKPVVNKIYISNNIDLFIDQLLKNKSRNNLSVSFNDNKNSNMPALDRVKNDEKKAKKMNNNMKENLNNLYSTVYSINDQPSNGYHRYVDNLDEQGLEVDKNMMKNNTLNFVEKFSCSNKNVSFYSFTTEKEYFKIEIKKTSRNKDKVKKKKKNIKNETRNNYDGSSLNGYKNYEDDQNDKNVSNSCMNENKSILNSIVSFITDNNKKNKYNKILDNTLKEHFINNSDNYFSSNDDSYYSETTSNENEYNKYNNIRGSNNIMDGNDNLENMSSPLEEENSYMEKSSNWLYLFLSLSLNIEKYSNHLFATSINTYINNNFSINEVFDVNNLKNEKNQGISCIINDLTITIGTLFFCYTKYKNIYCNKVPIVEEKLTVKSMERHIYSCDCNVHKTYQYLYSYSNSKKNESNNIIFMCIEGIVVGFYTLVDNIKPEVFELINFLKREKKNVYVCTGDNYMNALYISKILGIRKENVSSNTLPLEKVQFVKKVQSMNDGKVCMIGDGINDCFALKTADLGLSLCTRTNVVMDSADACIVDNNINVIIKLFEISRKTLLVIKFNFLFSFFINIFFILLASGAFYSLNYVFSPFLFTFLMFCSSIIVILSSLSLKLLLKDI